MKEFLIAVIAIVVVAGGVALVYFLLKKYFASEGKTGEKTESEGSDKKSEKAKAAADKKAAAEEAAKEKNRAAAEKRKAEMMKKTVMEADPKVLQHRFIKKAADEISKNPRAIEKVTVKANRIDWTFKEDSFQEGPTNVFFDDPSLSRLEQGEMKLVAEHIYGILKNTGFELEEVGSGEKGTFRYHIDEYIIKAL